MIKTIVFDFDGVIIKDSEFIKKESWRHVFPELGIRLFDVIEPLINKYSGGKGSRFEIIRDVCVNELGLKNDLDHNIGLYSQKYNEVVQESIVNIGVNSSDIQLLENLSKRMPLFLNTATPIDAISETIAKLNIGNIFKKVFGYTSNFSKVDNLKLIMSDESVSPDEILFIGDSESDYLAAKEVGVKFVGFKNNYNKSFDNSDFPVILYLSQILDIID